MRIPGLFCAHTRSLLCVYQVSFVRMLGLFSIWASLVSLRYCAKQTRLAVGVEHEAGVEHEYGSCIPPEKGKSGSAGMLDCRRPAWETPCTLLLAVRIDLSANEQINMPVNAVKPGSEHYGSSIPPAC